jgi:hypothetical protein
MPDTGRWPFSYTPFSGNNCHDPVKLYACIIVYILVCYQQKQLVFVLCYCAKIMLLAIAH